jgi:AraC family transcriptional regulator of adaptative response / DNA-3-methyladenine glycosylase II
MELRLPYRRPFDWASLIAFLKPRAIPGVELVSQGSYQRTIEMSGVPGIVTIRPDEKNSRLVVRLDAGNYDGLAQAVERVRRMFDLSADPVRIVSHLSLDPKLTELVNLRPGIRVPGVWDGFEIAVLSVLGQSLTNHGPRKQVSRIVQLFGTPFDTPIRGLKYLFPKPEMLADVDLSIAGIDDAQAGAIRELAASVIRGQINFETSRNLEQAVSEFANECGIDESAAHYIAMRAFGEPDAFPATELLRRRHAVSGPFPGEAPTLSAAERWRPWRAYAAMHLTQPGAWSNR